MDGKRKATVAGAVAAVLLAGIGVATLGRGPETRIETRPNAGPTAGVPSADASLQPGTPADAVVISPKRGVVALLDTSTGSTVRVLAEHPPAQPDGSRMLQGVSLAPDRRTAYYAVSDGCEGGTLHRVAVDGRRRATLIGAGVSPSVSPDGRRLAYAAPGPRTPEGLPGCPNVVVVRDLGSGEERRWRFPDDEAHRSALYTEGAITKIAWAPDSRRLAFTLSYEGESVSVLDTDAAHDLAETVEVVVPGGGGDSRQPTWQSSTGRLAVVNSAFECCYEDDYEGPSRTLLVDVDARTATDLLRPGLRPAWLDFDDTGDHLLYVDGGTLYRKSGSSDPVLVAPGFSAADW